MKTASPTEKFLPPNWIRLFILVILVLGIFFRVSNVEKKVYWHDENITSIQTVGYIGAQVRDRIFDGSVLSIQELQKYQKVNSDISIFGTINSFAEYDPHHPPIYYIILRVWMQIFGNSIAAIRSLSIVFSLLAFPCLYWLCRELFNSSLTGWLATAMLAVSPFHLLYAQEAREYSLWTVTTLLASAALLRAIRLPTKFNWGLYGLTVALGLYSHLFFVLVLMGHGFYILLRGGNRWGKTLLNYLLSLGVGLLIFMPWIVVIVMNLARIQESTSWSRKGTINFAFSFKWWGRNLSHLFVDLDPSYNFFDALGRDDPFLIPLILLLVGYAIYFLCRQTPRPVWSFVLILLGATSLPLVLPDILSGGWRSLVARYFTPGYLCIQLAVAYLLASQLSRLSAPTWHRRGWQLIFVLLVTGGVVSCFQINQADAWWNKHVNYYYPQGAKIINRSERPLIVSDTKLIGDVLALSYLLDPKVKFQLWTKEALSKTDILKTAPFIESGATQNNTNYSNIFLFNPSGNIKERLTANEKYDAEPVYENYGLELWELMKVSDGKPNLP